jgi:predicted phage terminase large subunit-like protein
MRGEAIITTPRTEAEMIDSLRLEMLSSLEPFCRAMYRAQYNRDFIVADFHKELFEALQRVVDGDTKRLMINMPPRYGKTETVIKQFVSWGYALNARCKFLHLSYSDTLVSDNSETIRATMKLPLYRALFPGSTLEREKGSATKWKTKSGGEFYAVSTQGQVTGFGAGKTVDPDASKRSVYGMFDGLEEAYNIVIPEDFYKELDAVGAANNPFDGAILIDDPLKPEDALSDITRERVNMRFESTIRNRVNSRDTPIIIIMQRLHEHDLCGYLKDKEPGKWEVLSLPAIRVYSFMQTDLLTGDKIPVERERALWPLRHTLDELHHLRSLEPMTFDTQYMQDPTPKEGLMYSEGFATYSPSELDGYKPNEKTRCNYTDTADTGTDSLCSICYIDTPEFIYVTDVLYTDEPMESTEPAEARQLDQQHVLTAWIESNNGGRGFARKVQSLLRRSYKNFRCNIRWFHQSANKYERIYNNSATVQSVVKFPVGWERKWPKFHAALMSYRKDNVRKNKHDDAPDALTGCVEMKLKGIKKKGLTIRN